MASVVRLKRYLSEEPSETLVINCKRQKIDDTSANNSGELTTLFTFAGTIKNQDEDIFSHIKRKATTTTTTKTDLEEQFKKRNFNITSKLRTQKQEDSKQNRYKIINCYRSQDLNSNSKTIEEQIAEFTVYDIESENSNKDRNKLENHDKDYVYDLYYTTSDDFGEAQLSEYIDIYPLSDDLVFGSARDNGYNDKDDDYDSEDSNAENYWRNDYPDEDEDVDSITEDDMVHAMERCDLSDLSSDDGEESFLYGTDDDIDERHRYGERFAKFMSKHQKIEKAKSGGLYFGDIDDNDDDDGDYKVYF